MDQAQPESREIARVTRDGAIRFVNYAGTEAGATDFCARDLNLLAHAQALELEVGSLCGGHGICGGDRINLARGAPVSPINAAEREHLSADELASGWRLACQCFPDRDGLEIEVGLKEGLPK